MNLRFTGGKIPIQTGSSKHPILLVDPPSREIFDSLFYRNTPTARKDVYWKVLHDRLGGKTLREVAIDNRVTRERVRQMEAKLLRMISTHYRSEIASEIDWPETVQPSHDNR